MRRFVALVTMMALTCFLASRVMASPRLSYAQNLNSAQCSPGPTNKMVLNIVYQVTNDADSGFGGYWAIDSYMKHVQVWDQENGTFCVIAKYNGSFVTVAGKSPSGAANVSGGVTGTMEGGYSGVITGAFNPGAKRTKGNIGAKDYACTITDGKAIDCSYFDWVGTYFTGSFSYDNWGWIYNGGDNGTWVNADSGSSGDITGS